MTLELIIVAMAGFAIAWANGANDVSKGIATLVGAGVTDYKRALKWGTLFTAIGAFGAIFVAQALVETFGGKLLASDIVPTLAIATATILGAAGWVLFATRAGLPVSTTHSIVGSLVGVTLFAFGTAGIAWEPLFFKVAIPLLVSPFVALGLTFLVRKGWERFQRGKAEADCICVSHKVAAPLSAGVSAFTTTAGETRVVVESCKIHGTTAAAGTRPLVTINQLHWLSAGLTSFARGLNDAPKLAGLMLAAGVLFPTGGISGPFAFTLIALAMTVGAFVAGYRVTRVLAEDVTVMKHREGFMANSVTSALVTSGAVLGLPMSTTHVSSSAIIGVGASGAKGDLKIKTVKKLLAAWVISLPGAALIGVGFLLFIQTVFPSFGA